jgi:tripartite-type tricarboxylate transporter receptor subunit TctC
MDVRDRGGYDGPMNRRGFTKALGAAGAIFAWPHAPLAQAWPPGRVTIIIPFPAGAATDISGRVIVDKLAQAWGQPVVIDNRGGGNGLPASEAAARARPDGTTLFLTSAMTQSINPYLYDKLPYHPIDDFEPITQFSRLPFVVLVRPDLPVKTLADLTAMLKAEPGKHNFGSGSLPARIASEMYRQLVGVDAVHIGYKSNPQAFPDLYSGRLTFMTIDITNGRLQVDAGKLRALTVTTPEREPKLPQVPTAAEAGLADFQIWTWNGFYAPRGTPREIVQRINRDIIAACKDAQAVSRFDGLGGQPVTSSPDEFGAFTRAELERWGKIIRSAKIKLD